MRFVRQQVMARRCAPDGEKETQSARARALVARSAWVAAEGMPDARGQGTAELGVRDRHGVTRSAMAAALVTLVG